MNVGDVILLSLRDFQDGKGDIILKYTADEARSLKSLGEIPEAGKLVAFNVLPFHVAVINETDANPENADIQFEFDEEDIDEI
jgi:translation initiation factor 1A